MSSPDTEETHPFEGVAYARFLPRLASMLPRGVAYSNEVGESFRNVIPKPLLYGSYFMSFGYIGIDTAIKVGQQFDSKTQTFNETARYQAFDTLLWHGTASNALTKCCYSQWS
jgi:hypothetical protein